MLFKILISEADSEYLTVQFLLVRDKTPKMYLYVIWLRKLKASMNHQNILIYRPRH